MGTIQLKNIKIYAFHGCLVEEGQIGSDYLVNLAVKADLKKASTTDELEDTVDYVLLQKIVQEEMAIRAKLLEHVARRIINSILEKVEAVTTVKVSVAKINPPIGGDVAEVRVTMQQKRNS
ncbi:dihydroneopterin aldolase [Aequorivita sp. Q41]|uniref:dihydroneopterin aldolase n=1 Tax=Aequorivita sp. Q41 TaxID=3153300 RepID=UPI0032429240